MPSVLHAASNAIALYTSPACLIQRKLYKRQITIYKSRTGYAKWLRAQASKEVIIITLGSPKVQVRGTYLKNNFFKVPV